MEWEGASTKAFQTKKTVGITNEHDRWDPLKGGLDGQRPATFEAGNSAQFVGIRRQRSAPDWPAVRSARDEAAASAFYAHDAVRGATILRNRERSGFDVMTAMEVAPMRDGFRARGRV